MNQRPQSPGRLAGAAILAICPFVFGCARLDPPTLRAGDAAFDEIHTATYGSADTINRSVRQLPRSAYKPKFFFLARPAAPRTFPPIDKIHPALKAWIATRPAGDVVEVVVTFVDTVRMPRFPKPDLRQERDHPDNLAAVATANSVINGIILARSAQYQADTSVVQSFGARTLEIFWLLQAALIEIPLGQVTALSGDSIVTYLRPNIGPGPPQHDGEGGNDVFEGRRRIGSDHYFDLGFGNGWMALLDTGVLTTHQLLWEPSNTWKPRNLCMVADCVPPIATVPGHLCSQFLPDGSTAHGGDMDQYGHGTSSAGILVGNGTAIPPPSQNQGQFRGVTGAWLDCFRVYGSDNLLRPTAAFRGFQFALARLNQVVVAEMQDTTEEMADVAKAADQAYEAGALVIAANGNDSSWGPGIPARTRRVLGVGAFVIPGDDLVSGHAKGPTKDKRLKPDILAPSYTETAANSPTSPQPDLAMHGFGGTSGATPYAAGAAFLLQNWMNLTGTGVDPGQVYAHLILSGDQVGPFVKNSPSGAGRIRLPRSGESQRGKVWVSARTRFVDIPIHINPGDNIKTLTAAIWWPELTIVVNSIPKDTHNDVNLEIRGPGLRGPKVKSAGVDGVFERASITRGGGVSGRWVLRIRAKKIRTSWPQVVYWGASLLK